MASSNNNEIISVVSPHTIKKFELIEAYVQAWAHKLLEYGRNTGNCNGIVFIDCMCNSGMYINEETGELVEGKMDLIISNRSIIPRPDEPHSSCDTYP